MRLLDVNARTHRRDRSSTRLSPLFATIYLRGMFCCRCFGGVSPSQPRVAPLQAAPQVPYEPYAEPAPEPRAEQVPSEPAERPGPPQTPLAQHALPLRTVSRRGGDDVAPATPMQLSPRAARSPLPSGGAPATAARYTGPPSGDALDDVLQFASSRGVLSAGGTDPLLRAGTTVRARYIDGRYYAAVVQGLAVDGGVRVRWTEYGTVDIVAQHDVQPW